MNAKGQKQSLTRPLPQIKKSKAKKSQSNPGSGASSKTIIADGRGGHQQTESSGRRRTSLQTQALSVQINGNDQHDIVSSENLVSLAPKLMRRFYGPLALSFALDPVGGEKVQRQHDVVEEGSSCILRNFLDAISYMCDREKGGDTTTAAALQEDGGAVVIWLAANRGMKPPTCDFLKHLLVEAFDNPEQSFQPCQDPLVDEVVQHNLPRLKKYVRLAEKEVRKCMEEIEHSEDAHEHRLYAESCSWLYKLEDQMKELELQVLVRFCYNARDKPIRAFLHDLGEKSERICFSELWHYIGRLGKHVKAVKALRTGLNMFPRIAEDVHIKCIPASSKKVFPFKPSKTFPEDILSTMFPKGEEHRLRACRDDLEFTKRIMGEELVNRVKESCSQTQVHAELLIVDWFRHNRFEFFTNDRYVGCSKAACYLCYRYIQAVNATAHIHEFRLVVPATSNKLHPTWRCPDVPKGRGTPGIKAREDDMNAMVRDIRQDVIDKLRSRGRRPWHPDSTTGISTVAGSRAPFPSFQLNDNTYSDNHSVSISREGADTLDAGHHQSTSPSSSELSNTLLKASKAFPDLKVTEVAKELMGISSVRRSLVMGESLASLIN